MKRIVLKRSEKYKNMKTRVLIKEGQYRLNKAGCPDPKVDSEELFCFLTGMDKVEVFLHADEEVDDETERKYLKLIRRREDRKSVV